MAVNTKFNATQLAEDFAAMEGETYKGLLNHGERPESHSWEPPISLDTPVLPEVPVDTFRPQ
jgi:hypothetical protein